VLKGTRAATQVPQVAEPAAAIDPETGDLYVVWEDARFSGSDETVITRSTDGGATWSTPTRVNSPTL
jgi:hypothetical protein